MKKTKDEIVEEALAYFEEGYACSQSVLLPFAKQFGLDNKCALALSSTFGGGMGRLHRTCGAATGAFMVLGLKYGNTSPTDNDSKFNAYRKVRELNKQFEATFGSSVCKDILRGVSSGGEKIREKNGKICDRCVETATALAYDLIC